MARDNAAWEASPEVVRKWFRDLTQPDNPGLSCCGEADAYYADSYYVNKGQETVAIITDDRVLPHRRPIAPRTEFVVPSYKLKYDRGNPTGRGVIFIGPQDQVLCYVAPGGV